MLLFTVQCLLFPLPVHVNPFMGTLKQQSSAPLYSSVEEILSVGTISNVETSYFTQLKICYIIYVIICYVM